MANIASATAAVLGLAMTIMGTVVTFNPRIGIKMWHFELPAGDARPAQRSSTQSLVLDELRLFAVRESCLGASIMATAYLGDRRSLGAMLFLGVPVVVVDGFVQLRQAGRGHWVHWGLAPLLAGLGLVLGQTPPSQTSPSLITP